MRIFLIITILSIVSLACSTHQKKDDFYENTYKGLTFTLPKHWVLKNSVFMDTVADLKKGELAPGLITTTSNQPFSGSDFLQLFSTKNDVQFEEITISFNGLPREIIRKDSILLDNAMWYAAVSKYNEHIHNFKYEYSYFGDFKDKGVLINFYSHEYDKRNDINLHLEVLQTIKLNSQLK